MRATPRQKQRGIFGINDALFGTLVGGALGLIGGERRNSQQTASSREQMQFQERMSSTSYQRAVSDMKEAGLNPMLAYSQGGASAPMGSMPQIQDSVSQGVASAAQAAGTLEGLQRLKQNEALTEQTIAQTRKIQSETMEHRLNTQLLEQQIRGQGATSDLQEQEFDYRSSDGGRGNMTRQLRELAEAHLAQTNAKTAGEAWEADVRKRKAEASLAELDIPKSQAEADFYKSLGELSPWLRATIEGLKGGSLIKSIIGKGK